LQLLYPRFLPCTPLLDVCPYYRSVSGTLSLLLIAATRATLLGQLETCFSLCAATRAF
jgi:hypothetical protein